MTYADLRWFNNSLNLPNKIPEMFGRSLLILPSILLLSGLVIASEFPWKLDRMYRLAWFQNRQKTGESRFSFTRLEEVSGSSYLLKSHRRLERDGQGQESTSELYFQKNGRPIRYTEETRFTALGRVKGRQEVRIRVTGDRLLATHVNNGKEEKAARHTVKVTAETFLYATHALEQWTVFAVKLKERKKQTLKIYYSEFARVLSITFTPQRGDEILEIGGKKLSTVRYKFVTKDFRWEGYVWIDTKGRLVQFESGPLKLVLASTVE